MLVKIVHYFDHIQLGPGMALDTMDVAAMLVIFVVIRGLPALVRTLRQRANHGRHVSDAA